MAVISHNIIPKVVELMAWSSCIPQKIMGAVIYPWSNLDETMSAKVAQGLISFLHDPNIETFSFVQLNAKGKRGRNIPVEKFLRD